MVQENMDKLRTTKRPGEDWCDVGGEVDVNTYVKHDSSTSAGKTASKTVPHGSEGYMAVRHFVLVGERVC